MEGRFGGNVSRYTLGMSTWPAELKNLTAEQACAFANSTGNLSTLFELTHAGKEELAALTSLGKSGDPADWLSEHLNTARLASKLSYEAEHVRSALYKLGIAGPGES